jgi:hypothetical protein
LTHLGPDGRLVNEVVEIVIDGDEGRLEVYDLPED